MAAETRGEFHRDLERLEIAVGGLLALVPDAVTAATTALLVSDESIADGLNRWRQLVEDLYADTEHTIEVVVARQAPVAGDLRFLLACVRLVPCLHEVVELVAEVAAPSHRAIGEHLTPRIISLCERLGELSSEVWATIDEVWKARDPAGLHSLRRQIDRIAEVRSALMAELASGGVTLPVAMEVALVARTFDRLAHQARNAERYLQPLVVVTHTDGVR
jgi:phosphate transport system protein